MWAKVFLLFEVVLDYNSRRIVEIILGGGGGISIFWGAQVNFIYTLKGNLKNFPSGSTLGQISHTYYHSKKSYLRFLPHMAPHSILLKLLDPFPRLRISSVLSLYPEE